MARSKHDVVAEFRQAEILQAACRVFARSGFEAATVDAVAAEAGVAKGTLYLYFKSKLDIYLAALKGELESLDELTHQRVGAVATVQEKIAAFVECRLQFLEEHRDFFKIYQFEFGHMFLHPSRIHSDFASYYQRKVEFLAGLIDEGIRAGEFHYESAYAGASFIYDVVRGVATRRLLGLSEKSLAEDTRLALHFVWSGMGVTSKEAGCASQS